MGGKPVGGVVGGCCGSDASEQLAHGNGDAADKPPVTSMLSPAERAMTCPLRCGSAQASREMRSSSAPVAAAAAAAAGAAAYLVWRQRRSFAHLLLPPPALPPPTEDPDPCAICLEAPQEAVKTQCACTTQPRSLGVCVCAPRAESRELRRAQVVTAFVSAASNHGPVVRCRRRRQHDALCAPPQSCG